MLNQFRIRLYGWVLTTLLIGMIGSQIASVCKAATQHDLSPIGSKSSKEVLYSLDDLVDYTNCIEYKTNETETEEETENEHLSTEWVSDCINILLPYSSHASWFDVYSSTHFLKESVASQSLLYLLFHRLIFYQ